MVRFRYIKKAKNKKKSWHKKAKKYAKKKMTIYKVPKQREVSYKRERWFDLDLTQPGGAAWVGGNTDPDVLITNPMLNMRYNRIAQGGDKIKSRVNWQPIFTFKQLPDLTDITNLYRLFKINKISITLYPMRRTNNILTSGQAQTNIVSPNVTITTLYATTGINNRLDMTTDNLSQVERKSVKLYNLGIGTKKIGWYYTPKVNYNVYSNPKQSKTEVIQVPDPDGPGTVDGVDITECFAHVVKKPGFMDIERSMDTEHYGPLISIRSVDGSNLIAGGAASPGLPTSNNFQFQARVTCYFTVKGVH